jgi:hypothetical protein
MIFIVRLKRNITVKTVEVEAIGVFGPEGIANNLEEKIWSICRRLNKRIEYKLRYI